jgi:hypothetical protein
MLNIDKNLHHNIYNLSTALFFFLVQDRLLTMPGEGGKNFGLSARSALNDRYFADNKSTTRSKSLDNLLPGPAAAAEENFFGLSESRLNQRYLSQVQSLLYLYRR